MKPFRVLFIKPPDNDVNVLSLDVPLGIMYLSACLKRDLPDHVRTEMIDLRLEKSIAPALKDKIRQVDPDLIGISLLTFNQSFLMQYLAFIRKLTPRAKIIIGGPGATYSSRELLQEHQQIDAAILGEGEAVFSRLVKSLLYDGRIRDMPGLARPDKTGPIVNQRQEYIADLDSLPFPDYDLIPFERYWGEKRHGQMNGVLAHNKYTHIISSRACPFHCIYCHNIFGKKLRRRSPENFVAEMEWLHDTWGIREFHIVDDVFNFDRPRMHAILNRVIDRKLKIKLAFPNGLRADMLETADLDLLKRAGAYMVTFAIETASPRIQKMIRKNLNIDKVRENIDYASSIGLLVKGFFMLGFPGETPAEIQRTIDFAVRSRLDLAHFFTVTPFPGTALRELARQTYPDWQDEALYHYWPDKPFYQQATGYNLNRVQKLAYLKFYGSLRTIKTFYKIPLKRQRVKKWGKFATEVLWK